VVAERMAGDNRSFIVVDPLEENVTIAKKRGYLGVVGKGEDTELLSSLGIEKRIQHLLCLTADDVVNVYITLSAKQMNPDIEVISRANQRENLSKLYRAGADYCVAPNQVFGLIAAEYAGQPVAFEAIYGLLTGQSSEGIEALRIKRETGLVGRRMDSIDFKQRKLTPFGVIRDDVGVTAEGHAHYELQARNFFFNPKEDFTLEEDDLLVLLGHEYSVVHFRDCLERSVL
jgi:voltage-gated potassium channel